MGILGKLKLKKRTKEVVVGVDENGEEVALKIRAPRLQEIEDIGAKFPDPVPPLKKDPTTGHVVMVRGPNGHVLKDGNGSPIPERNEQDPNYLKQVDRLRHLHGIALVLTCLDDQITPETKEEDHETAADYYEAVWRELEDAGIDVGAFKALSNAAGELGAPMTKDEINAAREALGADRATQQEVKEKLGKDYPKAGKSE